MRTCDVCNKSFTEGYVIRAGEKYYCSETCLRTEYTEKEWQDLYKENDQSYWTNEFDKETE